MPSKITLDTDSITIRRLFALNPATQGPVPEGQIPVVGSNGLVGFYSTIEYFSTISSVTSTDSVLNLLSYVQPGLSSISTQTRVLTSSMTSTFTDSILSSFSSILEPSVNFPLTSTVAGLGQLGYISSVLTDPTSIAVYGFTLSDGSNSAEFTLSSPYLQINNDYLPTSTSLISTVRGLGSAGYVSTQYFSNIIFQSTISTLTTAQQFIDDIAYGAGRWVAVSPQGYTSAYRTTNLVDWILTDTALAGSIAFGNGLWIAGTDANRPKYSSDGITWTGYTDGVIFDFINTTITKVLYTPDGWYVGGSWNTGASGSNNSSIMHSVTGNDNSNWFPMEGGVGLDSVYDIAYNTTTGEYMTVGYDNSATNNILVSTDGLDWSYATTPTPADYITSVATNSSNRWIIFNGTNLYITTDFGSNWSSPIPFFGSTKLHYLNNAFYATSLGDGAGTSTLMKSTDGSNWTPLPFISNSIIQTPTKILKTGDTFIAGGITTGLDNSTIVISVSNDTSWGIPSTQFNFTSSIFIEPGPNPTFSSVKGYSLTVVGQQSTFLDLNIAEINIIDIKYGSNLWIGLGYSDTYWSSNTVDWTLGTGGSLASIDTDPTTNLWLGGINPIPKYSTDGFSWTTFTNSMFQFNTVNKVQHTPDGWYVAGEWNTGLSGSNNSSIMHSVTGADDSNWFAMAGGVGIDNVTGIAYQSNTGHYMAVGTNGEVAVSINGSNWSLRTGLPGTYFIELATNQSNRWIAYGQNAGDYLYVTTDFGSNWSSNSFFNVPTLNFKNGSFYAMTNGDVNGTSTLIRSSDGIQWDPIPFLDSNLLLPRQIEYAQGRYVIGGLNSNFTGGGTPNSSIAVSLTTDSNWKFPTAPAPYPSTVSTTLTTRYDTPNQVQVNDTFVGTPSTIIIEPNLISTVQGLGTAGYESTVAFSSFVESLGSFGYVSTLVSTISTLIVNTSTVILDSFNVSTFLYVNGPSATEYYLYANDSQLHYEYTLRSTIANLESFGFLNFQSTTQGLGSAGYVSTASLTSSFSNLLEYGYVNQTQINSTIDGLDGLTYIGLTPTYMRTPPPFSTPTLFRVYISTLTIDGKQLVSTPINTNTSRLFSTIDLHLEGYSNTLLPTSKLMIEIPVNTSFQYYNCAEQEVKHSWYLMDSNAVVRGPRTNYVGFISSATQSNISFGTLRFLLNYNELTIPNFEPKYTLMLSTSAIQPFSTVVNMTMASTSVNVKLNNLNR